MRSSFYLIVLFGALCLSVIFVACDKEDKTPGGAAYFLSGNASQAPGVPANDTSTAKFSGWYDESKKTFSYTIKWYRMTDSFTRVYFHGPADSATQIADTV